MTQLEPLIGTPAEIRDQLARQFPGWSVIRSDRGRWWASRLPLVSEKLSADAVDSDDPNELRAQIIAKDNARVAATKRAHGGSW